MNTNSSLPHRPLFSRVSSALRLTVLALSVSVYGLATAQSTPAGANKTPSGSGVAGSLAVPKDAAQSGAAARSTFRGEGTWNEEFTVETVPMENSNTGAAAFRYSLRLHICGLLSDADRDSLYEWLSTEKTPNVPKSDAEAEADRARVALKILDICKDIRQTTTLATLYTIAKDYEDNAKTAWKIRAYQDHNPAPPLPNALEVTLVGTFKSKEDFATAKAYVYYQTSPDKAGPILNDIFNNDPAAKILLNLP